MDVLVMGGTRLVGRALVEALVARGHRVSLFNRGRTDPGAFPGIERLVGDRGDDLSALEGRRWDAAIDVSGYKPDEVRRSATLLADAVDTYLFVSTVSVYSDGTADFTDEHSPVFSPDDPEATYGANKVACERIVRETFGDRGVILRPGIVIGLHDYTDRFSAWCRRIAEGGEVLAPEPADQSVQWIDARDLAAFAVRLLETDTPGLYNVVGPPTDLRTLLDEIRAALGSDARFTWVDRDFLMERGVKPQSEMPFWIGGEPAGLFRTDASRARAAGLVTRPVADSARDTLAWEPNRPLEDRGAFLPREREAEILAAWAARE